MSHQSTLIQFKALSADPADRSGIATFSHGGAQVAVPLPSFEHARQLEGWANALVRQARADARAAAVQYLRGVAERMEGER